MPIETFFRRLKSKTRKGDLVRICVLQKDQLECIGVAEIANEYSAGLQPPVVRWSPYGKRFLLHLKNFTRITPVVPIAKLIPGQYGFSKVPEVEWISRPLFLDRRKIKELVANAESFLSPPRQPPKKIARVRFPPNSSRFTVIGLVPTAATWESSLSTGTKKMPSFALNWDGKFSPAANPLSWHKTNDDFHSEANARDATLVCIAGPAGTNGPRLKKESGTYSWDTSEIGGNRDAELALSQEGVKLFLTNQNTVRTMEAASRWVARSLVLFSMLPEHRRIETHPSGAFTYFSRLLSPNRHLTPRKETAGHLKRVEILQAFIPELTSEILKNREVTYAVCAAFIAGLHQLGFTTPFGSYQSGGRIWLPDIEKLGSLVSHES